MLPPPIMNASDNIFNRLSFHKNRTEIIQAPRSVSSEESPANFQSGHKIGHLSVCVEPSCLLHLRESRHRCKCLLYTSDTWDMLCIYDCNGSGLAPGSKGNCRTRIIRADRKLTNVDSSNTVVTQFFRTSFQYTNLQELCRLCGSSEKLHCLQPLHSASVGQGILISTSHQWRE